MGLSRNSLFWLVIMKHALVYLVTCLWVWSPFVARAIPLTVFLGGSPPTVSVCATTDTALPYDHFLEGFQTATTGVNDGNAWTVAADVGTGTIDRYYDTSALTTNKPNGCCDRAWRIVLPTDGTETYTTWDRGTNYTLNVGGALTHVFHLYVQTAPDPSETYSIYRYGAAATGSGDSIQITNVAGTIQINASGQTNSSNITISTGQWYKVTLYQDTSYAGATSWISVDDGTQQTFQRTANYTVRYLSLGASSGLQANESGTFIIDLIAIDQ